MIELDGAAALAWRLRQHALAGPAAMGVVAAADRVVATRAWPRELAELALAIRQADPQPDSLARALETGELLQSYAFRGGSYVFTPAVGAVLLAVRTASQVWTTRRWQGQMGAEIDDWEPVRSAVLDRLAEGPATRAEIADHLRTSRSLRHLADAAESGAGSDSLYKPLHWWGDICFGPPGEGQSTFRSMSEVPGWPGLPDADAAGREAVLLYLGSYGPATLDNVRYWLGEGLSAPKRRLWGWVHDLGDQVVEVTAGGIPAFVRADTLEEMLAAEASEDLVLVPGYDPWVLGPGTADTRIVAPPRRPLATRGTALVLRGGATVGTWRRKGERVEVDWFSEAGPRPHAELPAALTRLGAALGRELTLA